MDLNATVMGAGSWGTTVASIISNNVPTVLWSRNSDTADEINSSHRNSRYLGRLRLSKALSATDDMARSLEKADVVIMGVPSKAMRDTLEKARPHIRPWVPIISLAKGFEPKTRRRMTEIIKEVMPGHPPGVLTGPNLAREIVQGYAAASVLAMEDAVIAQRLQRVFRSDLFRVYTNSDMTGCELGGALKNVIAIATGMGDGLAAGENTRSAVITRGLAEITRLGQAMGGEPQTFAGLAGMGDLMATCTSELSRNYRVGFQVGKGRTIPDIIAEMNQVAEGINSSLIVKELAEEHGVVMPIAHEVYRVCHEGSTALAAFEGLVRIDIRSESDPG